MRVEKFVLWIGVCLFGGFEAFAQSQTCGGDGADDTAIQAIEIIDGNLVAEVRWSPRIPDDMQALLEISDRLGAVVSSQPVIAAPGDIRKYTLTREPSFFVDHGYWFKVRIRNVLGTPLASPVPALVSLCPAGAECTYSVVPGVGTDAVAMESELFELLEDLDISGSRDLLQDALAVRPDLDYQIYWVADQVSRLQQAVPTTKCDCLWFTEYELNPASQLFTYQEGSTPSGMDHADWEVFSAEGPGANFELAGQILGGPKKQLMSTTQGKAGLKLRCRSIITWTAITWKGNYLAVPIWQPCSRACPDATVDITGTARTGAAANAIATSTEGARSSASASVGLYLEPFGPAVLAANSTAIADRAPTANSSEAMVQDASGPQTGQWLVEGTSGSASFFAQGSIEVCLEAGSAATYCSGPYHRPSDDSGSWAYGCALASSSAHLVASASCAQWPEQEANLWSASIPTVDLLILPWRPPD